MFTCSHETNISNSMGGKEMKKRLLSVLLATGMVATTLVGCTAGGSGNKKVGVAMPTKMVPTWRSSLKKPATM